jgi:hypothetical protein
MSSKIRIVPALLLLMAAPLMANEKDWSTWAAAQGDDTIQFRWQLVTYGGGLSPDCNLEVRNTFADVTEVVVRFDVERSTGTEPAVKRTIYLDKQMKGVDSVSDCKNITQFTIVKTDRRSATAKPK